MKIGEISNEELFGMFAVSAMRVLKADEVNDEVYETYAKELLTRLDRGEKAVKAMEEYKSVRQKIWDVVGECGNGKTDRQKICEIESILLDSDQVQRLVMEVLCRLN